MSTEPRPAIRGFATFMEETLQKHDGEKGPRGWITHPDCTVSWLLDRLQEEVTELSEAYCDCDPGKVQKECADVANFAMMIADRIRNRGNLT